MTEKGAVVRSIWKRVPWRLLTRLLIAFAGANLMKYAGLVGPELAAIPYFVGFVMVLGGSLYAARLIVFGY